MVLDRHPGVDDSPSSPDSCHPRHVVELFGLNRGFGQGRAVVQLPLHGQPDAHVLAIIFDDLLGDPGLEVAQGFVLRRSIATKASQPADLTTTHGVEGSVILFASHRVGHCGQVARADVQLLQDTALVTGLGEGVQLSVEPYHFPEPVIPFCSSSPGCLPDSQIQPRRSSVQQCLEVLGACTLLRPGVHVGHAIGQGDDPHQWSQGLGQAVRPLAAGFVGVQSDVDGGVPFDSCQVTVRQPATARQGHGGNIPLSQGHCVSLALDQDHSGGSGSVGIVIVGATWACQVGRWVAVILVGRAGQATAYVLHPPGPTMDVDQHPGRHIQRGLGSLAGQVYALGLQVAGQVTTRCPQARLADCLVRPAPPACIVQHGGPLG